MPFTLRGTKQSASSTKSCREFPVLQFLGLQLTAVLTKGISPTADNALYNVEVTAVMKVFFNFPMVLETFTSQAPDKKEKNRGRNVNAYNSGEF